VTRPAPRATVDPRSALRRRDFVRLLAASAAGAVALRADAQPSAGAPPRPAQDAATGLPVESPTPSQITGAPVTAPETPGATMQGEGYRPVRLPAKPGARASMDVQARDALEHQISCPCPCTLDVFTCRTSMPCGFSPPMHKDVVALVDGGYSADEILAAFEQVYGEEVLMAPKKAGFNWAGYIAPFAVIGGGGVALAALMRRWSRRAAAVAAAERAAHAGRASGNGHGALDPMVDATPDELSRLEAAVRGGDDR
jgi:cytochrome c-type biogenesis protein CcmH